MSSSSESGSDKILFQKDIAGRGAEVLDDAEFVKMYDRTTAKTLNNSVNSGTNDNAHSIQQQQLETKKKWKVGDQCMAPYEADGKWYPAKIEDISAAKKTCTVSYIGYDQKAVLKQEDLLGEDEVATEYSHHLQHQSTDLNWYCQPFNPLLLSEQTPPMKRRRLSINQAKVSLKTAELKKKRRYVSVEFGGFFKMPDIPQHILEGKIRPQWEEKGRWAIVRRHHKSNAVEQPSESDVEAADEMADEHEAEGTSETTNNKNVDSEKRDAFPIPELCPPPPPSMFGKIAVAGNEKEALTNMLMSWYMSGYHTGFYQGVMHEKTSRQKPK